MIRRLLAEGPVRTVIEVCHEVAGLLGDQGPGEVGGHADDVDPAGGQFHEEQDVQSFEEHGVDVKKSQEMMLWARAVRNWVQVGPDRRGAGSTPAVWRIFQTVLGAT